jgi:ATP-dependent Lon protease
MTDAMNQTQPDKGNSSLPPDSMIILPVRQTVLFPGTVLPLTIARPGSVAAAQEAVRSERPLGVILQADPAIDDPTPAQLHRVGTSAQVLRYVTAPDGTHHVICQGVRRFRIIDFIPGYPYLVARVEEIGVAEVMTPELEARVRLLKERMQEAMQLLPNVPAEFAAAVEGITSASALADFVSGVSDVTASEKQEIDP